jgi:hypothetical protein
MKIPTIEKHKILQYVYRFTGYKHEMKQQWK